MTMLDSDLMIAKGRPYSYTFNEDKGLDVIKEYIDKTYTAHYGNGQYQATDMIIDVLVAANREANPSSILGEG